VVGGLETFTSGGLVAVGGTAVAGGVVGLGTSVALGAAVGAAVGAGVAAGVQAAINIEITTTAIKIFAIVERISFSPFLIIFPIGLIGLHLIK
jgi:hypothetical protein